MDERKKPRAPRRQQPRPAAIVGKLSAEERAVLQQMIAEVRAERLRLQQAIARG